MPGTYSDGVGWDVRLLDEVESWLLALDDDSYDQVAAAIDKLEHDGPPATGPATGSAGTTRTSRKLIGGTTHG